MWGTATLHSDSRGLSCFIILLYSSMLQEVWVQSQLDSYQRLKKWYLMTPSLTLSLIRFGSRVKWSNTGKGVAPLPTPWCYSFWKWSPWVTRDYICQLLYINILWHCTSFLCIERFHWWKRFKRYILILVL